METQPNYVTGKDLISYVDELNQYLDKRGIQPLLKIIHAEVHSYGDALRFELHQKVEKIIKASEMERMQAMTDLERRISRSIAENTKQDTIRLRWIVGLALTTLANLIAVGILYAQLKGRL